MMYNSGIDPRIFSVFSTSAFRFGHSMIPESFHIGSRTPLLRDLFNKPFEVYDNLHHITYGLINATGGNSQRAQRVDRHFVREITNHLFQPIDRPFNGLDLVALNIQRGRDHGLPSYPRFRQACGLRPVNTFQDSALGTAGRDLAQIYSDVNDIDVFTGSMVEPPEEGAIVGPTIACILARQFHSLKYGDRFYFEAFQGPNGFSQSQRAELRKATLGWVLCNNLDFFNVQRDVFRIAGRDNPVMTCEEVMAGGPDLRILAN
ncbi:peroxidase-like protein 3 [Littorina saxatilis]|uniref:peroxidase-like protein 3 n=1 Tax=Littorina saxatilis TaxID=31220 RepID=UPI0038B42FC2